MSGVTLSTSVLALLSSVESSQSLVLSPSISELGVVVTKRAPSGMALSPRLALSPERRVVVTEHAPSGVASLLSGVASLPEHGVVVIVAAIDDMATMKKCFVGVGSGSRGDSKRDQVPLGR